MLKIDKLKSIVESEKLDKVFAEALTPELSANILTMALALQAGKKVEISNIEVELELPTALIQMFSTILTPMGLDTCEIIGQMASEMIVTSLKESLGEKPTPKVSKPAPDATSQLLKDVGIDTSKIDEKIEQMKKLAEQVKAIQVELSELERDKTRSS